MLDTVINWIKERYEERTTWDGGVLIAIGVIYIILQPIAIYAAYGAIAYGIWTLVRPDS